VGVEVMGELAAHFKKDKEEGKSQKRLGIVARTDTLLPYFPRVAQVAADTFMERHGVIQHLSQYYDEEFKQSYQYDHVILCQGQTHHT